MKTIELILGPMLVGAMLNVLLLGVVIVQCTIYFETSKRDKKGVIGVWTLLILDLASSCLAIAMAYNYLVTNFDNVQAIQVTNAGLDPYPLLTGLTALLVQSYFAWKIDSLSESRALSVTIFLLSIVQMLASLGTMIGGIIEQDFVKLDRVKQISLVWLFVAALNDAIITISLAQFLNKSKIGFLATDTVTSRLIHSIIQTGLLTTACALGFVITFLASPNSTLHLLFGLPLSKLYTNSLMSFLNAHGKWHPDGYTNRADGNRIVVRKSFDQIVMHGGPTGAVEAGESAESHELELRKDRSVASGDTATAKLSFFGLRDSSLVVTH